MNAHTNPWDSLAEQMLSAVAIKIELPPSGYITLMERSQAIEKYLKRGDSPLRGMIQHFYLQGSVAIGATIKSRRRSDGFDIDIVVELAGSGWSPHTALDELYNAMRGAPKSKYHDMTIRQTRCVTIEYADDIHVDLTPAEIVDFHDPRRSVIFHAKPSRPPDEHNRVPMNSFAFVQMYNKTCYADAAFMREYGSRAVKADQVLRKLQIDTGSLPQLPHSSSLGGKSATTVALQLIKRYLNNRWEKRSGRRPASVMLSCLALEVAAPGYTISQNLVAIAENIFNRLSSAGGKGELIQVLNPCCPLDNFTDRWPEDLQSQSLLVDDMSWFLRQIHAFFNPFASAKDRADVLKELFGEDVVTEVMMEMAKESGRQMQTGQHLIGVTGSILPTTAAAGSRSTAPLNTFYGSWGQRR